MQSLLMLALEAHNENRNNHRRYVVEVGRDLLGDWSVTIRYGRTGSGLQILRFGSPDEGAMRRVVHERLRRRLTAPARIGCAYQLRTLDAVAGFATSAWIPQDALTAFMAS